MNNIVTKVIEPLDEVSIDVVNEMGANAGATEIAVSSITPVALVDDGWVDISNDITLVSLSADNFTPVKVELKRRGKLLNITISGTVTHDIDSGKTLLYLDGDYNVLSDTVGGYFYPTAGTIKNSTLLFGHVSYPESSLRNRIVGVVSGFDKIPANTTLRIIGTFSIK